MRSADVGNTYDDPNIPDDVGLIPYLAPCRVFGPLASEAVAYLIKGETNDSQADDGVSVILSWTPG